MRTKGHLEAPWLGESVCGCVCAFRREEAAEIPAMMVAEQKCVSLGD